MGGGGGKGNEVRGQNLLPYVNMFERETRPARGELFSNITEALRTGGVGARMPIVQNATTASNQATGQALRNIRDQSAASGLSGTPYEQSALGQARVQGAQQSSNIMSQIAQQIIGMAPAANPFQALLGSLASQGTSSSKQGRGGLLTS